MVKTLKGKITLVYLSLVFIIALVGIASVVNLYGLRHSLDGLMTDNYKSINAANNMAEVVEKENTNISEYVYSSNKEDIDSFYESNNDFYKWLDVESGNITEKGEAIHVENIKKYYSLYLQQVAKLEQIRNTESVEKALDYFNSYVIPSFSKIRLELRNISVINEEAMVKSKKNVIEDTGNSMNLILVLSVVSVIGSSFIATFFVRKFLRPINLLTETMKKVKEGDLQQQAPIITEDEIGIMAYEFNNMTKRLKQFEDSTMGKLLDEKNKSLAIVKSISDPLLVLDINCKVLLINNACENFFNINEEKACGVHLLEVIKNSELFEYIWNVYTSRGEYMQKIMCIYRGNSRYYFNVIVTMVKDSRNLTNNIIVFFQNVTELKKLEKMKTDFVSSISHEFKTPLTSLIMGTDLLMDENIGILNNKQLEIIKTVKEDSNKLVKLVSNLLTLAKIEYDKSMFKMEYCDLENIISGSIKEFSVQSGIKEVKLYYEIDNDLPKVYVDGEKLGWVLNNLISNALKSTKKSDSIIISAKSDSKIIRISVRDTGRGIPKEYLERIFDKFVQVKDKEFDHRGTGLGLAIVKQIIEAHGGQIRCESQIGQGSNFIISLPVRANIGG